jgi:hypothetical protein
VESVPDRSNAGVANGIRIAVDADAVARIVRLAAGEN